MEELIDGFRRFRRTRWPEERALYAGLAENGQRPLYLVIACCDSRVDPATIFNARPGELFVIRNVANIVPPYELNEGCHGTSAAISFAVLSLQVKSIVVLGHAQCGGISAALSSRDSTAIPFLDRWVDLIRPILDRPAPEETDRHTFLERAAIILSLNRLMTFPFVAARVNSGALSLHGARFGIADGCLEVMEPSTNEFRAVEW